MRHLVVLGTALVLVACSPVLADREDYAAYRRVRLAVSSADRLRAIRNYLQQEPHGRWALSLREELAGQEQALFGRRAERAAALRLYLELYPRGQHRSEAQAWLVAHGRSQLVRRREEQERARIADARPRRAQSEGSRWLDEYLQTWLLDWSRPLSSPRAPRGPTVEALRTHWPVLASRLASPPQAVCDGDLCERRTVRPYVVPVPGGTRLERELVVAERWYTEGGVITRAELVIAPYGTCSWWQFALRQPCDADNPQDQQQAQAWAQQRVGRALEQLYPFDAAHKSSEIHLVQEAESVTSARIIIRFDSP